MLSYRAYKNKLKQLMNISKQTPRRETHLNRGVKDTKLNVLCNNINQKITKITKTLLT